jgi:hypothetical protein
MNEQPFPKLVLASLVRIRCFLNLRGMKQTGFAELFAGQSCRTIAAYFRDCGLDLNPICSADPSQVPPEFDANMFVDNCSSVVYLGVRCA